jgi:hypothetical protein
MIGPYSKKLDPISREYYIDFEDIERFKDVIKKLKIIARATIEDKFILVSGIKDRGRGFVPDSQLESMNVSHISI